jgi:eukaryotic-like serine/threonine-protein kinase
MNGEIEHDADNGPALLSPGACIAPGYAALELLRRGDALDVYDAWSEERACRCVAKVLRPERCGDRAARDRLLHEGRLLLGFSHPHLVRAYDLIDLPSPVLILETLTGETLGHLIATGRHRLPLRDVAFLGLHLCSALQYLHRHDVLHLDLKPSNIMAQRGTAILMDLSIARPPGRARRGIGTPQYMAPEQACGDALGPATDVWGLGMVLFEALTGRRAGGISGDNRPRGCGAAVAGSVRHYRRLPRDVAHLVDECLATRPADRPTVAAIAASLRRVSASHHGKRSA